VNIFAFLLADNKQQEAADDVIRGVSGVLGVAS
jgi:hypothetical protein